MHSRDVGAAALACGLLLALALPVLAVLLQSLARRRRGGWRRTSGGLAAGVPRSEFCGYREIARAKAIPASGSSRRRRVKARRSTPCLGQFSVGG
jgi:hypothetical protein